MANISRKTMTALRSLRSLLRGRTYTARQAAAITGMPLNMVNHAISRDLAPLGVAVWGDRKRSISYDGLVALRMARDYPRSLTPASRIEVIEEALRSPRKKYVSLDDGKVVVRVDTARRAVSEGLSMLQRAESIIVEDADTLNGEPCFKGTRVPVYAVASLANSEGIEEARQTYSKLTKAQIDLACFYATARPRRGRPKRVGEVLAKRRPKSSRTISIAID
jgi:uncharacterized protein (DUF433 family)